MTAVDTQTRSRTTARPRRSQEQRRRETQDAILEAALKVLLEEGLSGFTTIAVAKRAGVSRGAQENYFPTRDALVAAAARHALEQVTGHARALAAAAQCSPDPVRTFLADSQSFFFSPTYMALVELVVGGRSDPTLARVNVPIVREFRTLINAIWNDVFRRAGYRRKAVDQFIRMTHYLLRGMALTSMMHPPQPDYAELLAVWRRLAPQMLGPATAASKAGARGRRVAR